MIVSIFERKLISFRHAFSHNYGYLKLNQIKLLTVCKFRLINRFEYNQKREFSILCDIGEVNCDLLSFSRLGSTYSDF